MSDATLSNPETYVKNPPRAWGPLADSAVRVDVTARRVRAWWRDAGEQLYGTEAELYLSAGDSVLIPEVARLSRIPVTDGAGVVLSKPKAFWEELPVTIRRGKVWFCGFVRAEDLVLPTELSLSQFGAPPLFGTDGPPPPPASPSTPPKKRGGRKKGSKNRTTVLREVMGQIEQDAGGYENACDREDYQTAKKEYEELQARKA